MALTSSIIGVVRKALIDFSSVIEKQYELKLEDKLWSASSSISKSVQQNCSSILQSGKNKGQECGKPCATGKDTCSVHSRKNVTGKTGKTESDDPNDEKVNTPSVAPTSTLKGKAVFHKSKFGNFVCDGFVFDKTIKGVSGKEDSEGKIVPLTIEEETKVRSLGLKVFTTEKEPPLPSKEENDDESELIKL